LDVDGEAGLASWFALLREHDALMEIETLGVATGRGSHLYFRWPENGAQIRNGRGTLGAGLDVRGERGYAICPPSTHASGKGYEWLGGNESRAVSEAPLWLLELVSQRKGVEGGDLVCGRCHPNPAEVRVQ
jgi:hypothetical protein